MNRAAHARRMFYCERYILLIVVKIEKLVDMVAQISSGNTMLKGGQIDKVRSSDSSVFGAKRRLV